MDGKWSRNSFLLGSSYVANPGAVGAVAYFYYLPTNNLQAAGC